MDVGADMDMDTDMNMDMDIDMYMVCILKWKPNTWLETTHPQSMPHTSCGGAVGRAWFKCTHELGGGTAASRRCAHRMGH